MTQNQTQNPTNAQTCEACGQIFNSDGELQNHRGTAHQNQSGEKHPASERDQNDARREQGSREKIA